MQSYDFKYKLGLSATIPKSKENEIKQYIGEIFSWSWTHPDVRDYIPEWYGEVYDSKFDALHESIYEKIMKKRKSLEGSALAGLCSTAIRMLCRDGAIALKETLEKENAISALLKDEIYDDLSKCDDAHKLEQMEKIISQHDFDKAIVFVDRAVLAKKIFEKFKDLNPVLLLGRIHSSADAQKKAVEDAKDRKVKLVISTSAGEEGIDLPSADLLIVWSNTVSVVRFIQRTGRIMRKSKSAPHKLKIASYIATPDTPDYDALWHGLCAAAEAGIEIPGIEMEALSKGLVVERVNYYLQLNPTSVGDISKALKIEIKRANDWLKENVNRGKIFYFYLFPFEPVKMAYAIRNTMKGKFDEYLLHDIEKLNTSYNFIKLNLDKNSFLEWINDEDYSHKRISAFLNLVCNTLTTENRIYALQEEAPLVWSDYYDYFEVPSDFPFELNYRVSNKNQRGHFLFGTSDEMFERVKEQIVGKKVFLNFTTKE
ncbi:MAG: helicase-related protein, partial [Thermoplasmata archaeon]